MLTKRGIYQEEECRMKFSEFEYERIDINEARSS